MYAIIYDKHDITRPKKKVISVHRRRATAERALERRRRRLGEGRWGYNAHIVWVDGRVSAGESISADRYCTWGPGEPVPEGELYPDSD